MPVQLWEGSRQCHMVPVVIRSLGYSRNGKEPNSEPARHSSVRRSRHASTGTTKKNLFYGDHNPAPARRNLQEALWNPAWRRQVCVGMMSPVNLLAPLPAVVARTATDMHLLFASSSHSVVEHLSPSPLPF